MPTCVPVSHQNVSEMSWSEELVPKLSTMMYLYVCSNGGANETARRLMFSYEILKKQAPLIFYLT